MGIINYSKTFERKLVKSPKRLDIEDNIYVLKIIHSVYKAIFNNKNYQLIRDKEFRLK